MNYSDFDFNLLKVLQVLLSERNTRQAAEILNTSQSSISRSLSKLRTELNDPLLVRESKGLKLTPRAKLIESQLPSVLSAMNAILDTKPFEPSSITRTISIALNGFLMESYGFKIFDAIKKHSPNATVELHHYNKGTADDILSGTTDAALNYYPLSLSKELCQIRVGTDHFVGICRTGHPALNKNQSVDELIREYSLSGLIIPEYNHLAMDISKNYPDIDFNPEFRSEQVNPILSYVKNTDSIFLAPKSFYSNLDPCVFSWLEPNEVAATNIQDIALVYNSLYYQSQEAKWIEGVIKMALAKE